MMKATVSLKQNCDFKRLYYRGRSLAGTAMVLYVRPNRLSTNRLGITTGTKLGCAVKRNRARRRLTEAYRLVEPCLKTGYDLVIVARFPAMESDFERIKTEMLNTLARLGVTK